jgi:hypothetical protein
MNDSAPPASGPAATPPLSSAVIAAVLAASFMVGSFAISSQSYWIDEGLSLIVAMAPDPAAAWKYAQAVGGSTLQMPLYHIYLYAWHKLVGGGEWAMRASNLPLFLLGQLGFLLLLRHRPKLALTACVLAAVYPVLWVYLDETRPYVMQYAAACWLIAALVRIVATDGKFPSARISTAGLAAVALAAIVLFSSSLIGVLWTASFLLAAFVALGPRGVEPPARRRVTWLIGLSTLALFVGFSAYYAFTWSDAGSGFRGTGASLLRIPFIAYEILGFSGFGPGKLQLRTAPLGSIWQNLPSFLPLVAALTALGVFAVREARHRPHNVRTLAVWGIALGLPVLAIFAAMLLFDHRPLPILFIPALPAALLALSALMLALLRQKSVFWRALAALFPLLWLTSALSLRWKPVHAKDDYRNASRIAAAALAENKEVWWAADPAAAYIYLTPVAMEEVPGRAWAMQAPAWDDIRFKFPPRVIVISKPDIYDPQGAVARYATENRFVPAVQLQAFTILARQGDALPAITP